MNHRSNLNESAEPPELNHGQGEVSPSATLDPVNAPSTTPNNQDLVVWSLYLLGGAANWIDVEALYLKAFELAPARLSWRTRSDLPDYKKCAKALQSVEARESEHEGFLVKQNQYFRMLSPAGLAWCTTHKVQLEAIYQGRRVASQSIHEDMRRLREVERSQVFREFCDSGVVEVPLWQLAEFLRCSLDSRPDVWLSRVSAIGDAAVSQEHHKVEEFVRSLSSRLQQEFKNGR